MGRTAEEWTINQDMDEVHLAEAARAEEVVVYWYGAVEPNDPIYGVIVGYQDPRTEGGEGRFQIDVVERRGSTHAPSGWTWEETGDTVSRKRSGFVVFGPANRDEPVYPKRPPEEYQEVLTFTPSDRHLVPFLVTMNNLMAADQTDTGEPAFDVRLDAKACQKKEHYDGREPGGHRHYRILVRPTMQPLLHDEIEQVLRIASQCELAVVHQNVGLEIRSQHDID